MNLNHDNTQGNETYENLLRAEPVDVITVILTIKHLKNTYSTGSDGIVLRYIDDSLPVIINYLTIIINTSIVTGKFPSLWKNATVIPILKTETGTTSTITAPYHCCQSYPRDYKKKM